MEENASRLRSDAAVPSQKHRLGQRGGVQLRESSQGHAQSSDSPTHLYLWAWGSSSLTGRYTPHSNGPSRKGLCLYHEDT